MFISLNFVQLLFFFIVLSLVGDFKIVKAIKKALLINISCLEPQKDFKLKQEKM